MDPIQEEVKIEEVKESEVPEGAKIEESVTIEEVQEKSSEGSTTSE